MKRIVLFLTLNLILGLFSVWELPAYQAEIGHTFLQERLGILLPDGSGVTMAQVEAPEGGDYAPDTANAEFTGKTISLQSGASNDSAHATGVGRFAYGITTSISPAVSSIEVWEANNWIQSGFLRVNSVFAPRAESQDIQNHSWIGSLGCDAQDEQALRRLDLVVNRDEVQVFAGVNNGSSNPVPSLLASAYNVTSVGLTSGNHSAGLTSVDGSGRQKPDIVAPASVVSNATPILSAAAALLLETARTMPGLSGAEHNEVIKAILLAGATKAEFSTWSHSSASPLDATFGAGELNIFNSYFLLTSGEQESSNTASVSKTGWNFGQSQSNDSRYYYFEVPDGSVLLNFSVALTWNREISGPNQNPASTLQNLDLRLYAASNMSPSGNALAESISTVDNVEHLYVLELSAGEYVIEVDSNGGVVEYGLAWRGLQPEADPTVVSTTLDQDQETMTVMLQAPAATVGSIFYVESTAELGAQAVWNEVDSTQSGPDGGGHYQVKFEIPSETRQFWRIRTVSQ